MPSAFSTPALFAHRNPPQSNTHRAQDLSEFVSELDLKKISTHLSLTSSLTLIPKAPHHRRRSELCGRRPIAGRRHSELASSSIKASELPLKPDRRRWRSASAAVATNRQQAASCSPEAPSPPPGPEWALGSRSAKFSGKSHFCDTPKLMYSSVPSRHLRSV